MPFGGIPSAQSALTAATVAGLTYDECVRLILKSTPLILRDGNGRGWIYGRDGRQGWLYV